MNTPERTLLEKHIDTLIEKLRQLNEFLEKNHLCSQLHKGEDEDDKIKDQEYHV